MLLGMYVCMYVCMYVVCMSYVCTSVCICMCACMYALVNVCMCMYVCVYVCMRWSAALVNVYICMMCVCLPAFIYVCMCVSIRPTLKPHETTTKPLTKPLDFCHTFDETSGFYKYYLYVQDTYFFLERWFRRFVDKIRVVS